MSKGYYNPRFIYEDFDATQEGDERVFNICLSKYHLEQRKIRTALESADVLEKNINHYTD